jgi:DNA-binding XRE family transcriptional regulator
VAARGRVGPGFVYLFRAGGHYKIGRSWNPETRRRQMATLPVPVELVHQVGTDNPVWLERHLHYRYHHGRGLGEWFTLAPGEVAEICALDACNEPPAVSLPGSPHGWAGGRATGKPAKVVRYVHPAESEERARLGRRLRELRELADYTTYELARAADLSPPTVYQIEAGARDPAWTTVVRLAAALNISVAALAPAEND